jgi:hypothetical protein
MQTWFDQDLTKLWKHNQQVGTCKLSLSVERSFSFYLILGLFPTNSSSPYICFQVPFYLLLHTLDQDSYRILIITFQVFL